MDPDSQPGPKPLVQIAVRTDYPDNQKCDTPYVAGRSQPAVLALAGEGNPLEFKPVPAGIQFAPAPGTGRNPWPTVYGDSVNLNYGYTNAAFGGFGWYHIRAKHGWTQLAADRTAAALDSADTLEEPTDTPGVNWTYVRISDAYSVSVAGQDLECAQIVAVNRDRAEGDPDVAGIITSFGADLEGYVFSRVITP